MTKEKPYRSISELSESISARLDEVERGKCSLIELDELLADIRELEERIIVIRYKGMERLKYPDVSSTKSRVADPMAPELPLDTITEIEEKSEVREQVIEETDIAMEEINTNQISLIDSIEEIAKESSVNESMSGSKKKSLAQKLQSKPVKSVMKALNLNLKMGLVKQVFKGDDGRFKALISELDQSENLAAAQQLLEKEVEDESLKEGKLMKDLHKILERRFS